MFKFLISACTLIASIAIAQAQPQNSNAKETKETGPSMNSLGEPHPCSSYFGFMHPSFREPGTYPKECIKEYDAAHPNQKKSRVGESVSF